ncbi:thymic stromal lymphopoietin [Sorex fumeus]|uniref:thymic stromal lymphopoietin n=1 Tax=Sorex fumeus TaxID=62283 RepID=UPI0024AD79B0|nr:thymic stromal lymphopoietin [Sorex fumeus]
MGSESFAGCLTVFLLSVFFRKLFFLQMVGLVLTYNFTDCNILKIKMDYQNIIDKALKEYINKTKSWKFYQAPSCEDPPSCLRLIQRLTFTPAGGCESLTHGALAESTRASLSSNCPGYAGAQINNTQAKKKREVTRKCLEQFSYLVQIWRHFSRCSSQPRNKS